VPEPTQYSSTVNNEVDLSPLNYLAFVEVLLPFRPGKPLPRWYVSGDLIRRHKGLRPSEFFALAVSKGWFIPNFRKGTLRAGPNYRHPDDMGATAQRVFNSLVPPCAHAWGSA